MNSRREARVIALHGRGNLYNEGVYRSLESLGITVVDGVFAGRWLLDNLKPGDVADIHWPSFLYPSRGPWRRKYRGFLRFVALLLLIRLRGGRIVWTAHNLFPHDRSDPPSLDVLARHLVIALAARIPVHGPEARRVLAERFPATSSKTVEIPHGHWIGRYPDVVSRDEARRGLGLPADVFVYLFVGLCKPYKNVDSLIEAFRRVPDPSVLLIAGKFQDPGYERHIRELAARDSRVRIDARYIPDEELQHYLKASDVVVAPYREILTSGSAVLAGSFGRPLISLDRGFLKDVVTPATGLLFSANDPAGLQVALLEVRERRFDDSAIRAHISRYRFEDAARLYAESLGLGSS